jgi:hypothetical protein
MNVMIMSHITRCVGLGGSCFPGSRDRIGRRYLTLQWKPEIRDFPIFWCAEPTSEGIKRALTYDAFSQYLRRLGLNVGFESTLTPYCIRRGTANAVDGKLLEAWMLWQ